MSANDRLKCPKMKGSGPKGDTGNYKFSVRSDGLPVPSVHIPAACMDDHKIKCPYFDARGLKWALIEKGIHQVITISG